MSAVFDLCVVGAGPAGLAVAVGSALRGLRVRVVEIEPRGPVDKACGEGLLPDAVAGLGRLGVGIGHGQQLAGVCFYSGGRLAHGRFDSGPAMGVRRTALHRAMLQRAGELGVEIEWGRRIQGMGELRAGLVVGADGGQSRVRSWSGLEEGWVTSLRVGLRQHFGVRPWADAVEVYWGDGAQAYVTPVGAHEVGVALVSRKKLASVGEGLKCFPELWERLRLAEETSAARGAATMTRRLRRVTAGRVALVGDASGSVDAITGEGISLCFRQAEALVEAIAAGRLDEYEGAHRRVMRVARAMSAGLLWMDRSAVVRQGAMAVLGALPVVFNGLLRAHVADSRQSTWRPEPVVAGRLERLGG